MPTDTDRISRLGVNAVEAIFLRMRWIFREQLVSDYGIDAQVEVTEDGRPTGKLLALQIKSGASFFKQKRGGSFVFRGDKAHLDYWADHSLPVFVILHNPDTGVTLWQHVAREAVKPGKVGAWSIEVPATNILDERAASFLAQGISSDPASVRRVRMALDAPLMQQIARRGEAFLTIDEWVIKGLNIRRIELRYDDPYKDEPDITFGPWMPARRVTRFMREYFPWLSYEYVEEPECFDGEIAEHILSVSVGPLGLSFLALEEFYRSGAQDPEESLDDDEPGSGEDFPELPEE